MQELLKKLKAEILTLSTSDRQKAVQDLRDFIHFELSPQASQPIDRVIWVPLDMVCPNDYNPNTVARKEMSLLYTSILHDGYTQPVVTIWDPEKNKYVIVDGFHRYYTAKAKKDIFDRMNGLLPIVVISKNINERMAATVRHNRARGRHQVTGMSSMVLDMVKNGMADHDICNELGLEPEELIRLKHITGISKIYGGAKTYSPAWVTREQIKIRVDYENAANGHADQPGGGAEDGKPKPSPKSAQKQKKNSKF